MIREDPEFWAVSVRKVLEAKPFMLPPYVRPSDPPAVAPVGGPKPSPPSSSSSSSSSLSMASSEGMAAATSSSPALSVYACVAIQPPAVVIGFGDRHALVWNQLKAIENGFIGTPGESWRNDGKLPLYLRSAEEQELFPVLRSTRVRVLVWCAAGYGLAKEGSSNNNRVGGATQGLTPRQLASQFQSHAAAHKPSVVVVCLKHGAKKAAETIAATMTGGTVVWVKADFFDEDDGGADFFFKYVVPIIDIVEGAGVSESDMRGQIQSSIATTVAMSGSTIAISADVISPSAPGIASWERPDPSSHDSASMIPVDNRAPFERETNVDRISLGNGDLLECDVALMRETLEMLIDAATNRSSTSGPTIRRICGTDARRCHTVAMDTCLALVNSTSVFTHIFRATSAGEASDHASRIASEQSKDFMLLWIDLQEGVDESEWTQFFSKNKAAFVRKTRYFPYLKFSHSKTKCRSSKAFVYKFSQAS